MKDAGWLDPGLNVHQGQQEDAVFFVVISHFTPLRGEGLGGEW